MLKTAFETPTKKQIEAFTKIAKTGPKILFLVDWAKHLFLFECEFERSENTYISVVLFLEKILVLFMLNSIREKLLKGKQLTLRWSMMKL